MFRDVSKPILSWLRHALGGRAEWRQHSLRNVEPADRLAMPIKRPHLLACFLAASALVLEGPFSNVGILLF